MWRAHRQYTQRSDWRVASAFVSPLFGQTTYGTTEKSPYPYPSNVGKAVRLAHSASKGSPPHTGSAHGDNGFVAVRTAKMKFSNTITIKRPPREIFAYLADFENLPRWNYAITEARKITPGPVGVGSKYLQVRTTPRRSEETFEVIEFEPDSRLTVHGAFGPLSGQASYLLDRTADGTKLTNAMDLRPGGVLNLVAPLATSRVRTAVANNLDKLREILEQHIA